MKNFMALLIFVCTAGFIFPQPEFTGNWTGTLSFNNVNLRIVFRIFEDGDSLKAFLDSPDQGAKDIAVNSIVIGGEKITLNVQIIRGFYEGTLNKDSLFLDGTWNQGGLSLPLKLVKTDEVAEVKRPQNPERPFPYNEEEVTFGNIDAGITLAGTFTYPKEGSSFPVVILVSGSGPQDRDESLMNHKPFLVLSDYLTRRGIAVLRYDDRGIGKSTGDFSKATTLDFVSDALAAVDYLMTRKEIDKNKIGLAGHSEGGLIAPMASNRKEEISFIVLMAGPGLRGDKILLRQQELIARAEGTPEERIAVDNELAARMYELIISEQDISVLRAKLKDLIHEGYSKLSEKEKNQDPDEESSVNRTLAQITSPWFLYFVRYDPYPELKKVDVPVLAVIGEKDLQVPAKEDLALIEGALKAGGNKNYKVLELPGLNHLFQTAVTGRVTEYGTIEETFSPSAMEIIADWIIQNAGKK